MVKRTKYFFGIILIFAANCGATSMPSQHTAQAGPNTELEKKSDKLPEGVTDCSLSASRDEREDCVRNTARTYKFGTIKSIKLGGSKYFDADGKACAKGIGPRLSQSRVRNFLENSIPISQMAVMNYYGERGECTSENVKITFFNGRSIHFSLSSEGKVGYLSPLSKGKEIDVFFYYCEHCKR